MPDNEVEEVAEPNGYNEDTWQKAPGIIYRNGETNPRLAERDYRVSCKPPLYPIAIHKGYHFWWCISHHQPLYVCQIGKTVTSPSSEIKDEAIARIRTSWTNEAVAALAKHYEGCHTMHYRCAIATLLDAYDAVHEQLKDAKADIEIQRARAETFAEKMDERGARLAEVERIIERAREPLTFAFENGDKMPIGVLTSRALAEIEVLRKMATKARTATFNEVIEHIKTHWLEAYPTDVFPEPPANVNAPCSRDLISAAMGRHISTKLITELETMRDGQPKGRE